MRSRFLVALAAFIPTALLAAGGDSNGAGGLVAALRWVRGMLLGNVAITIAAVVVAAIGFMMLGGRLNWRVGATVIIGGFILFGAGAIVSGMQSVATVSL